MKGCIRTLVVSLVLLLAVGVGTARADILTPPSGQPSLTQSQSSTQSQDADNKIAQDATSQAISAPGVQTNVNTPVRVMSNGSDGDVNQSNSSVAVSEAENNNHSNQSVEQGQGNTQSQDADQRTRGSGCCDSKDGGAATEQRQRSS